MQSRSLIIAVVFAGVAAVAGGADTPDYELVPHSDSQYAHELFRLKQIGLMKAQETAAAGTAAANLWKAELLLTQFDELTQDKAKAGRVTDDYLAALSAYFKSQTRGIDGAWALDHAQFILSKLAQPILTRMEYWSNSRRDRQALAPLSALGDGLIKQAGVSLDRAMRQIEAAKPFDDKAYALSYAASAEVKYYSAWSAYFRAMALEPTGAGAAERKALLAQAGEALNEWAVDDADNGVSFQAYLLRGKVMIESGDLARAIADLAKAQSERAPNWVQYQGRYQTVVAYLRSADISKAQSSLDAFKRWIPKDNTEAQLSADMLAYRVAWAAAEARPEGSEKRRAQREALNILAGIIDRDPRFRTLVYEQLAAQIPENADVRGLQPMQQVAYAWGASQNQKGDTTESRRQLQAAVDASLAVKANTSATYGERAEATFLAGACNALLNNLAEAARYNVEFAEMSPKDPRAKAVIDLALQQIGEMRKAQNAQGNATLPPALRDLANKTLALATTTYGDKTWLYAQARMLEESDKLVEAAVIYEKVAPDDRNYVDARYRLVTLATDRFSKLPASASSALQKRTAEDLFAVCSKFSDLLDHPPATAPHEVLEAARAYRYNVWLIEAAAALHPGVKNLEVAQDRLNKLDEARAQLSEAQRATALRYRVEACQMANQPEKAMQAISDFAKSSGGNSDAMNVIRGMVLSMVDEIDKAEPTDAAQAKRLAANVVQLLNLVIQQAGKDGKKDVAFEYRIVQADMMVRAGEYKEAQELSVALQKEKDSDIRPYMTEARAIFIEAQATSNSAAYAKAQDYFTRILARLTPGSEGFWECWLRIMQSVAAQGGATAVPEIKKHLGDLKGVYGSKFGGERFKADFASLAVKYAVE